MKIKHKKYNDKQNLIFHSMVTGIIISTWVFYTIELAQLIAKGLTPIAMTLVLLVYLVLIYLLSGLLVEIKKIWTEK